MELRQLRYLDAVGELGSFSAAARRLHVVQPAISQQIRKLESELGLELVHRGSPASLTAAGERVARRARVAMSEIDAILAEAKGAADTVAGRLNVGTMHWLGTFDVPAMLARFAARHPEVVISLTDTATPAMVAALRRGDLDVSFASLPDAGRPRGFRIADIGSEELLVAGAPGTLPDTPTVHLHFLHERPFVAFAEGMNLRATVDGALSRADVRPHVTLESNEPLTVRDLAAHGLGYALLPRSVVEASGAPIAAVGVHPAPVMRELSLLWLASRPPNPAAQRFIAMVRDTVRS